MNIQRLRITGDFFNFAIFDGNTISYSGTTIDADDEIENWFDHRAVNKVEWNVSGVSTIFEIVSATLKTGNFMCIVDGHNLNSVNGVIGFINSGGSHVTSEVQAVHSCTIDTGWAVPDGDSSFSFRTTTSPKSFTGVSFQPETGNWSANAQIGILHMGRYYDIPTNANASLSWDTRYYNKVNTARGGASYSTLYNNQTGKRTISATWEYVAFSGGEGVTDLHNLLDNQFGSHVPVHLNWDLDETNVATAGANMMFARIMKWKSKQMSPNAWSVSATFEEFI